MHVGTYKSVPIVIGKIFRYPIQYLGENHQQVHMLLYHVAAINNYTEL